MQDVKRDGLWLRSYIEGGKQYHTKSGNLWAGIRARCQDDRTKALHVSYADCSMSESFKDFQFFAGWCQQQIGYGLLDYDIDKDLLLTGNKIYGEDTCVFIPSSLNKFLVKPVTDRGFPTGVCLHKRSGKFRAQIRMNNRNVLLGEFITVESAAACYTQAKQQEAQRWASRLAAGEFAVDKKVIARLQNWC